MNDHLKAGKFPQRVSVVLPTYNRAEILRKVLRGYAEQAGEHQMLEVLVVDDGSKDQTRSVVEACRCWFTIPVRYLHQENRGQAAARNHGIREARGELLLFGDDDIIPSRRMVAEHVAWHSRYPEENVGILGQVTWAPEVRPTPFMKWSGMYGQFRFGRFTPGMEVDFWHVYSCNTSAKARFLIQNGKFNEAFAQYGWEDVELSYRLYQKGFRMLYSPEALGYHYKFETFEASLRRMEKEQRSLVMFATTDAGRCFLEQMRREDTRRNRSDAPPGARTVAKRLLWRFETALSPVFRYFLDTRIPLPARLYSRVVDYYSERISSSMQEPKEGNSSAETARSKIAVSMDEGLADAKRNSAP